MKRQIKDFRGYKVMTTQCNFEQVPLEQIKVIKLNLRVGCVVYRD
jgi:hypothetical protein